MDKEIKSVYFFIIKLKLEFVSASFGFNCMVMFNYL